MRNLMRVDLAFSAVQANVSNATDDKSTSRLHAQSKQRG